MKNMLAMFGISTLKAFLSACFLLIEVLSLQPNLLRRTHGVSPVPLQLLEYQHDKMIQNDIK